MNNEEQDIRKQTKDNYPQIRVCVREDLKRKIRQQGKQYAPLINELLEYYFENPELFGNAPFPPEVGEFDLQDGRVLTFVIK